MSENCTNSGCIGLKRLEEEVRDFRTQNSETHRQIFDRVRSLEQSDAVQRSEFKTINQKLDQVIVWQEQQKNRPRHLQERLIEGILLAVACAFVGYLLAQTGIA